MNQTLTASVELAVPFKIEDKAKGYVIKPGQAGFVLTGEVIDNVTARALSSDPNSPASKIVDGSGLRDRNKDGLMEHSANASDMWLSAKGQIKGWVEFDLGNPRRLDAIEIWNYNQPDGTRRGIQKADISVWTKQTGWRKVQKDFEFDRAPTGDEYDDPTFVDMSGVTAAKVRFDNIKNFDDANYVGLSEVRFYEVAGFQAVRPVPADGTFCDGKKVILAWMPGNEAQSHKVYLGTDSAKLEFIGEKAGSGLMRAEITGLAGNTKYFWRVDEISANGRVISGKLWSFTSPGLAGWWKFDEENGTTAKDSSGNGHDGVLRGNCTWRNNAGRFGGAIDLDGVSAYVEIGDENAFDFADEITVCCWLNTSEVKSDWAGLVTKGDDAWRLSTVNKQRSPHFSVGDWQQIYLNGSREVTVGDWHHFAGVYDGRQLRLYVDGQPDASIDWDGGIATNDVNVLIGENAAVRGRLWKGLLDDVRIYSFALSKEDIAAAFRGEQPKQQEAQDIKIKFNEPLKAAKREQQK